MPWSIHSLTNSEIRRPSFPTPDIQMLLSRKCRHCSISHYMNYPSGQIWISNWYHNMLERHWEHKASTLTRPISDRWRKRTCLLDLIKCCMNEMIECVCSVFLAMEIYQKKVTARCCLWLRVYCSHWAQTPSLDQSSPFFTMEQCTWFTPTQPSSFACGAFAQKNFVLLEQKSQHFVEFRSNCRHLRWCLFADTPTCATGLYGHDGTL